MQSSNILLRCISGWLLELDDSLRRVWDNPECHDRDLKMRSALNEPGTTVQERSGPDPLRLTSANRTTFEGGTMSCSGIFDRQQEIRYPKGESQLAAANGKWRSTDFCLASNNKYLRSRSVCSDVFMLTNVVAIPVLPDRPVLPISCT